MTLAIDATVRGALNAGRPVRLFDATIRMPYLVYSVAYPETRRDDPMIREFSSWIHAEVAREGVGPDSYALP